MESRRKHVTNNNSKELVTANVAKENENAASIIIINRKDSSEYLASLCVDEAAVGKLRALPAEDSD